MRHKASCPNGRAEPQPRSRLFLPCPGINNPIPVRRVLARTPAQAQARALARALARAPARMQAWAQARALALVRALANRQQARAHARATTATTTATTTMTATSGEIKATIALRYGRRVRRAGKPLRDSATDQTTSSHRGAALPARKNPGAAHDGRAQAIVAAQRERGSGRLVASVSRGRWLQHGASWSATKHHRGQPRPGRPGVPAQARADPRQGPTAGHQLWSCMAPPWRVGR